MTSTRRSTQRLLASIGVFALVTVGLFAAAAPGRAAGLIVVTNSADTDVDGDGCTLREAVANANGNNQSGSSDCSQGAGADTIEFAVSGTITLGSPLPPITGDLDIEGPGPNQLTISGNDAVRILEVTAGVTLDVANITLAHGSAFGGWPAGYGGAIFNGGALTVTGSVFDSNRALVEGGGIYGGQIEVRRTTFHANRASGGSAIFGGATIVDSTFDANVGHYGGAVVNHGDLLVTGSTFVGNSAPGDPGYPFSPGQYPGLGGAITNFGATALIENSTFSMNTADLGGAVYSVNDITFRHSTFFSNTASGGGVGVETDRVFFESTILVGTTCAPDFGGSIVDGGYNIDSGATCGFDGTSLSNTDPSLAPLADNGGPTETMAVGSSSPAIDMIPHGENGCGNVVVDDQRGFVRPFDDRCDAGAYEYALAGRSRGTLTVDLLGIGEGSVTSEPLGISCPEDCTQSVAERTVFVLTAHPADGSAFQGWGGECDSKRLTCRVRVRRDRDVTASFG